MSTRLFVTRALPPAVMDALEALPNAEVRVNPHDRVLTRAELLQGVRDCDLLLCQLTDRIDREVLEANPNLKLVANYAVGYDNGDLREATSRRVPVTNTPGVLTNSTADLTWALINSAGFLFNH